ncbi:hypothetical protein GWA97_02165 [Flavobacterium sp. LaA7.5]|nr:hypothetical protein [Flavobacterium salilacus subsp. altitudinum]
MIAFLIKSAISMGVLLGVYHLFLEREKMHRFNRFYLLFSVAFSLVLPLIIIPIYVEAEPIQEVMYNTIPATGDTAAPVVQPINYLPAILWSLYGLFTAAFLFRFIRNLLLFKQKISSGKIIRYENTNLVLIAEKTLPHTFLNYIFINEQDYEAKNIENELFTHELTHVKQKHTLDILFIETLKTIFWFNPLLYLYGQSIRLNHEFLADGNVVDETQNVISYQKILLQKTSGLTPAFASNLNFSLTKKRLLMMTKTTSRTKALLLQIAVTPVMAILLMLLCTEEIIAQETNSLKDIPANNIRGIEIRKDISQFQIDSLKKIDPVKYRNLNTKDYYIMKITYVDENGKTAVKRSFEPNPAQAELTKLSDSIKETNTIDPLRIRKIEYVTIEGEELAKLKQDVPLLFKDPNTKYRKKIITYVAEDGSVKVKTTFENVNGETTTLPMKLGPLQPPFEIEQITNTEEDVVYNSSKLTKMSEYSEGGMSGFYNYINQNFKIPEIKEDITARIYVSFIVEKDGSMSNIKILRDPGHGLGDEALRVLKTMDKKWIPGEMDGKPVRASYNLPITINIRN